ncbi:LCP family protein [Streptomyces sp. L2]|uniref:LCP family protein n=1 Tax=Streptomyces sp. L2 TaxID=2162665 RepID=UPI00101116F4|nr:LCP family protein [Streptomyces sp. L2]
MTATGNQATSPRRPRQHTAEPPRRPSSRGGRPVRPRGRGTLRKALLYSLSLAILGVSALGWTYLRLSSDIGTFDGKGLASNRPEGARGENILIIGSDARTDGNRALAGGSKSDTGRSDTTLLLHIHADRRHATAVSIPRDTLVTVPPCRLPDGTWTKSRANAMFNSAFSVGQTRDGNPACTQNTVEQLTGLRVDHTVVVDFKGFAALTDAVGGVQVCLPKNIYERDLDPNRPDRGTLLFTKGEQTVSGEKALSYVRIRHGIGDGSDLGRIKRQQAFVSSLMQKIEQQGLTPARLLPLADAAVKSMTVDPGLGSANKLISFVMSLKDIGLHDIKFVTLPWRYEGARVAIVQPDAEQLWAALKADRILDDSDSGNGTSTAPGLARDWPSPADAATGDGIEVSVYNGTTVSGLAHRAATTLTEQGFTVTDITNAGSQDHATTLIQYGPGLRAEAGTVARLFPDAQLRSADAPSINVILGRSYGASPSPTALSLPTSVANDARSADDDLCSQLSYG